MPDLFRFSVTRGTEAVEVDDTPAVLRPTPSSFRNRLADARRSGDAFEEMRKLARSFVAGGDAETGFVTGLAGLDPDLAEFEGVGPGQTRFDVTGTLIEARFRDPDGGWLEGTLRVQLADGEEMTLSLPINLVSELQILARRGRELTIRYQPETWENDDHAIYALEADGRTLFDYKHARQSYDEWHRDMRPTIYVFLVGGLLLLAVGLWRFWKQRRWAAHKHDQSSFSASSMKNASSTAGAASSGDGAVAHGSPRGGRK